MGYFKQKRIAFMDSCNNRPSRHDERACRLHDTDSKPSQRLNQFELCGTLWRHNVG